MGIWKKAARAAILSRKNEIDGSEKAKRAANDKNAAKAVRKNTHKYFEHYVASFCLVRHFCGGASRCATPKNFVFRALIGEHPQKFR